MAGAPVRRASYKDTLQPALHRRFSSTAILLLAVSYLEALLLANWSSYFWSWFPFGPVGFRTLLIFSCGLSILILRIAHYHVGLKTTESGLQGLISSLLSLSTYETAFWYCTSSFLFCAIFLFSMSESSNLRWITYLSGSRARVNERPLFLACYLGVCALFQTITHYRFDIDRLDFNVSKRQAKVQQAALGVLPQSFQIVLFQLPGTLARCTQQAVSALLMCLFVYYFVLRSFAWGWALALLRPFYSLPKTNIVPATWPTDIYLLVRCIYAGTLMQFVWAAGNTAFSVFMVREPLKNGNPLTSESKDPNGSLLNGLKSKKLSIKSFAMWELALIAQNFEVRRQAIFCDIDRKDGPMWSQVYAICMGLLKQIETRVDEYGKPPPSAFAQSNPIVEARQRTAAPLRQEPIFTSKGETPGLLSGVEKALDQLVRSPGSSPVSELSPLAKKTWRDAKDRVLTKEQQEALSPEHLRSELGNWMAGLVRIDYIGRLFRHDFRTRVSGVMLGTPYAEPTLYANAAQALCLLAVHSLAEDVFGNVHRDVPSIIRTLTAVIRKVEGLVQRIPLHWTDASGTNESPEVDQILDALRGGLEQVVTKFEPYSNDLRLSLGDVRLAKEAILMPERQAPERKEKEAVVKPKTIDEKKMEPAKQRREFKRAEMEQTR
ncbi:nuclear envelope protein [Metarhizium album ARSEF 1941]|uniref:Nuclear envelope protein n=1 Tax=Metarhizium album (strain ARSEF 1941) TaxID=1081103 RepID=A0A0B2WYV3_METAS|nr:nuclear envelope protein [Metarhizium album ARSEF 1941]KHN99218.1 nuclear envelope protein [Metarhizium album ARSEF 1941]